MTAIAPNLTVLVGGLVGARLIAHAGTAYYQPLHNALLNHDICPVLTDLLLISIKVRW